MQEEEVCWCSFVAFSHTPFAFGAWKYRSQEHTCAPPGDLISKSSVYASKCIAKRIVVADRVKGKRFKWSGSPKFQNIAIGAYCNKSTGCAVWRGILKTPGATTAGGFIKSLVVRQLYLSSKHPTVVRHTLHERKVLGISHSRFLYGRGHKTTARGPNLVRETISSGPKDICQQWKNNIFLRNICWPGRM